MVILHCGAVCDTLGTDNAVGAQTERRGDGGSVQEVLGTTPHRPSLLCFLSYLCGSRHVVTAVAVYYNGRSVTQGTGVEVMAITIEAVYENGVLKPTQPLPLKEHEKVQIIVKPTTSRVRQTAGLIGWTGSQEEADFVALSPELDPQEST